jgi:hypothetical protein
VIPAASSSWATALTDLTDLSVRTGGIVSARP